MKLKHNYSHIKHNLFSLTDEERCHSFKENDTQVNKVAGEMQLT